MRSYTSSARHILNTLVAGTEAFIPNNGMDTIAVKKDAFLSAILALSKKADEEEAKLDQVEAGQGE